MARKYITKEVVLTQLTVSEMKVENGKVVQESPFMVMLTGKLTDEQIKKELDKQFKGKNIIVLSKDERTKHYRMETEKFLELAEEYVKQEKTEETEEALPQVTE